MSSIKLSRHKAKRSARAEGNSWLAADRIEKTKTIATITIVLAVLGLGLGLVVQGCLN